MVGKGYVHFKYSRDADECALKFSVERNGRLCFARYCSEEIDIWRCHTIGGTPRTFNVSLTADRDVILARDDESWGLVNFGKPPYVH